MLQANKKKRTTKCDKTHHDRVHKRVKYIVDLFYAILTGIYARGRFHVYKQIYIKYGKAILTVGIETQSQPQPPAF